MRLRNFAAILILPIVMLTACSKVETAEEMKQPAPADITAAIMAEIEIPSAVEKTKEDVVFDFSETTFIDSSGIGLVLGRYNQLKFEHRTLILTGLNQVAYRLFELTGLFQIMPYYTSLDDLKEGVL